MPVIALQVRVRLPDFEGAGENENVASKGYLDDATDTVRGNVAGPGCQEFALTKVQ